MEVFKMVIMCVVIFMIIVFGLFQAVWPINDKETSIKHKVIVAIITIALSVGVMFMFDNIGLIK